MRRPSAAREAPGFFSLMQTGWADAACIARVPLMPAGAGPLIFLARRSLPASF